VPHCDLSVIVEAHYKYTCCYRLTVTDSDGAQNYTFADATVLKGWTCLQSNKPYFSYFSNIFSGDSSVTVSRYSVLMFGLHMNYIDLQNFNFFNFRNLCFYIVNFCAEFFILLCQNSMCVCSLHYKLLNYLNTALRELI